jgi:hypothetical protein
MVDRVDQNQSPIQTTIPTADPVPVSVTSSATPVAGESQEQADARAAALETKARQDALREADEQARAEGERSATVNWGDSDTSPLTGRTPEEVDAAIRAGQPVTAAEAAWAAGYRNFDIDSSGNVGLGGNTTLTPRVIIPGPAGLSAKERTFAVKEDWKPVETNAQGRITAYEDESGLKWYTPDSLQWKQGYIHWEPGVSADNPVEAAPFITVQTADGGTTHITRKESIALGKLRSDDPEAYVEQLARIGIAPAGAEYVGGSGDDIQYSTPAQRAEIQATGREAAKQRVERVNFLTAVLPQMPKEYQDAYSRGDTDEMSRLAKQYETDYENWMNANIRSDDYLRGIEHEKGAADAIAAWEKRQSDIVAIEARAEDRRKKDVAQAVTDAMTRKTSTKLDATTLTSTDITVAYRDLNKFIADAVKKNPNMSTDERAMLIENSAEYKRFMELQKVADETPGFETQRIYDIGREALSLGKVQTPTYNRKDIEEQYYQQKEIALATFLGDTVKLGQLFSKGYFGTGGDGDAAYLDALNVVQQQNDLKAAVTAGDVPKLTKLYEEGAFGDDADGTIAYQNIRDYVEKGGRTLSPITADDIRDVEKSIGTKEAYVKGVEDAQPTLGYLAKETGIALVPVWGTAHHWDQMSGGWKAASIATDVLAVVPIVGGVAAAAKVASTAGKMARVATVTKVIPRVVARELLEQINPIPILSATKAGVTAAARMILDPRRIPYAALGAIGTLNRGKEFVSTALRLDYIPLRSMSREAATHRVVFSPAKWDEMIKAGATEAEIIDAGTEINKQLTAGKKYADVTVRGVKIRVKNVPYQEVVDDISLFNATPDITQIDRGGQVPLIKDFYTSAKVAVEPLQRSYLEGRRATNPGIVEIRIKDPAMLDEIMPQRKIWYGKDGQLVLEPEAVINATTLKDAGYRLEPIPGRSGRGITFDASVGPVEIRRYTLARITDNPTGLQTRILGGRASTGTVAIGDIHATGNFRSAFDDINSAFDKPVIGGNPDNPSTWKWTGEKQTVVVLGDIIDRGNFYDVWRKTLNRLSTEAQATGGRVERVLGNHELAYISKDKIPGTDSLKDILTDAKRKEIASGIIDDIRSGYVKAAVESNDTLFTHAGVSSGVFPNLRNKTAKYAADYLNKQLLKAAESNNYRSKMFAKGRVEKGHSLRKNERDQGGIFWLRPQEALNKELSLGFRQVVGHNPGDSVRRVWNADFIEVDVTRRAGGRGFYADTPYAKTVPVDIKTTPVPGKAPKISAKTAAELRARAMTDTVADVFLGWDGRSQAVRNMLANEEQLQITLKALREEMKIRKAAGDSIGAKFVRRQIRELTKPTGGDYLYGGIGFWRDVIMGRQNSVRVLDSISSAPHAALLGTLDDLSRFRAAIASLSPTDVGSLFRIDKATLLRRLDAGKLRTLSTDALRRQLGDKLRTMITTIDDSVQRNVEPYMDRSAIANRYTTEYQRVLDNYRASDSSRLNYAGVSYDEPRLTSIGTTSEPRLPDVRIPGTPATRITSTPTTRIPSTPPYTPSGVTNRIPAMGEIRTPVPTNRVPDVPPRAPDTPPRTPDTPPRTPDTPPPPVRGDPPPVPVSKQRIIAASPAGAVIPEGSITWAQGEMYRGSGINRVLRPVWKYIPPEDFGTAAKPRTVYAPPHGARNIESTIPAETIQVIGKTRKGVPKIISIDLGWADIEVLNGTDIRFVGAGETTNVGTRLPSKTMGMAVSDNVPVGKSKLTLSGRRLDDTKLEESPRKRKVVYRTGNSKKKPSRKGLNISEFTGDISMASIRRIAGI